jgi:hypothetical protein
MLCARCVQHSSEGVKAPSAPFPLLFANQQPHVQVATVVHLARLPCQTPFTCLFSGPHACELQTNTICEVLLYLRLCRGSARQFIGHQHVLKNKERAASGRWGRWASATPHATSWYSQYQGCLQASAQGQGDQ